MSYIKICLWVLLFIMEIFGVYTLNTYVKSEIIIADKHELALMNTKYFYLNNISGDINFNQIIKNRFDLKYIYILNRRSTDAVIMVTGADEEKLNKISSSISSYFESNNTGILTPISGDSFSTSNINELSEKNKLFNIAFVIYISSHIFFIVAWCTVKRQEMIVLRFLGEGYLKIFSSFALRICIYECIAFVLSAVLFYMYSIVYLSVIFIACFYLTMTIFSELILAIFMLYKLSRKSIRNLLQGG